jgi:phage protein U
MANGNSMVMMALGDFRFSLDTAAFQELSRTHAWRWASVDRIGAKPAMQFVGPGEESITMNGTIYPAFRGGLGQIEAMRVEANKGEPLMLVDGTGQVWGKFCITEIRETRKVLFSDGTPRAQDFDISLQAYGGDDAGV